VLTNGLCWWLVAGFCAGKLPGIKNLAALAVVCANKLIALPLVFLYWLHPTPDRSPEASEVGWTRRRILHFTILITVSFLATFTWGSFAQKQFIPYDTYNPAFRDAQTLNEGVDPARQQTFIFENPLFFAKTAVESAVKSLPATAAHFVGKFGWEKNYLHPVWLALLWLALSGLFVSAKNPLSGRQRLLAAGVALLFTGMFAVTMYVLWCPVGAGEITNFQGRYFVPIAPVAALALAGGWLRRFENQIWLGAVFILIMSNLAMIVSILGRYYGAV